MPSKRARTRLAPAGLLPALVITLALAAVAVAVVPSQAQARAWRGFEPGRTTADEVVAKLGEPGGRPKSGGRTVLLYKDEGAPAGTKETRFYYRADGVVDEVLVYLATSLDAESIEGEFGKPERKTFTEEFLKVWQFPRKGVTVYFDKDGGVMAIAYSPAAPASGAAKSPAADAKAP